MSAYINHCGLSTLFLYDFFKPHIVVGEIDSFSIRGEAVV